MKSPKVVDRFGTSEAANNYSDLRVLPERDIARFKYYSAFRQVQQPSEVYYIGTMLTDPASGLIRRGTVDSVYMSKRSAELILAECEAGNKWYIANLSTLWGTDEGVL